MNFKKIYSIFILSFLLIISGFGQTKNYNSFNDSDPKAIKIINHLKKIYYSSNQITTNFSIRIDMPNNQSKLDKGTLVQHGKKYILDLKEFGIINDGKIIWMINKKIKEVQINNYSPNESSFSMNPLDIVQKWDNKKFVAICSFDGIKDKKKIQIIEIKPLDKKSDFSKVKMSVLKTTGYLSHIEVINKDGSNFKVQISAPKISKTINNSIFTFKKSAFPNFVIEDLRI